MNIEKLIKLIFKQKYNDLSYIFYTSGDGQANTTFIAQLFWI